MPIDEALIRLADLASKIENVRALLDGRRPLDDDDREAIESVYRRMLKEKYELEESLRRMAGDSANGVSGS